ncbi:hypothetical protein Q8F55_009010 [Vanrija albida]|uniref:Oxidoreductase AflY n=1 Tax=Vanrija albida TaxID=181172 RepID=A0ABR3PSG8_9TREE
MATHSGSAPLLPPPPLAASFPASTARPSSTFTFVGATPEATATLRRVLEENDRAYDVYMGLRFAHNHFSHSVLARYALGGGPALLQRTWEHDRAALVPLDPASQPGRDGGVPASFPDTIDTSNWASQATLGKKPAYARYLSFFHAEVGRLGAQGAIDTYLLAAEANGGEAGPEMLIRLVAGITHPFIHLGLGVEFGERLLVAEALASAAVHVHQNNVGLFPDGWPQAALPQASDGAAPLLGIYAALLSEPRLDPGPFDPDFVFAECMRGAVAGGRAAIIQRLVARWDLSDVDAALDARVEEVAWLATLLAGATSKPGYPTRVDFFLMHALTSSVFLPALLARLGAQARRIVLQSYVLTILQVALARGRPRLYPAESMSWSAAPAPKLPARPATDVIGDPADPGQHNPWLAIVANALVSTDSHVPKSVRALLHYAQAYGSTPRGGVLGAEAIPGGESLDGSLFVRVAGRILDVTGWVAAGEPERNWDRSGLGWDAVWDMPDYKRPESAMTVDKIVPRGQVKNDGKL